MDKPAARSRPAARASRPSKTPAAAAEKRPRGRPRKTLDERDDGNRRLELITAAARLFRQKGFDATSTRDIAAAVGMHSGSPFYHFKSKGALLHAVMEEGMRSAIQRQATALQPAKPVPDATAQLRLLIRNHFDVLLGPGSDFIPVMLYESRSITARQRALLAKLQSDYEAVWEPVLEALAKAGQLKGPVKLARLLMFGALNWSVQWFDAKKSATLDDLTDAAMALFIHVPARGKPTKALA
ncbi:TetR/AcrR family transcriptional regulator [Polaromonas sp. CT11-55]|uniref:TetR/AcrR family transcriptional regulator n=1 Tax=Polaromonas sp. CT11-55 TaxID=3243045 RepID=UPI0039A5494A